MMAVFMQFLILFLVCISVAQEPFRSLENTVGYIIIQKGAQTESYIVTEEKDGSVRLVKTAKNPKEFLRKSEEGAKR